MNKKIGFIGCGKMAQAIIEGILKSGDYENKSLMVSSKTEESLQRVQERFSIQTVKKNTDIARWADILFLAIKPDTHEEVIKEIKEDIREDTIVVTIAAGITLEFLEQLFGKKIKAVRSMPNTPSLVGEGMSAVCFNELVSSEDRNTVLSVFNCFGKVEVIEEKLMNSIPAISGSSPAYVYMFIEALADGGVKQGIPREKAYHLAAQAVLGAAKMVLDTGKHPGELKDAVCTPGGATIEAVLTLEDKGFRAAILGAMDSCTQKTEQLTRNK